VKPAHEEAGFLLPLLQDKRLRRAIAVQYQTRYTSFGAVLTKKNKLYAYTSAYLSEKH